MPNLEIYAIAGVASLLIAFAASILIADMLRQSKLAARVALATREAQNVAVEIRPEGSALIRLVSKIGMLFARSGVLSGKTIAEMTATLEQAGFRGGRGLGLFIGA